MTAIVSCLASLRYFKLASERAGRRVMVSSLGGNAPHFKRPGGLGHSLKAAGPLCSPTMPMLGWKAGCSLQAFRTRMQSVAGGKNYKYASVPASNITQGLKGEHPLNGLDQLDRAHTNRV